MESKKEQSCSLEHYRLIRETKEYRNTPFGFREHICKDKKLTQTAKLAWIVLSDYSVFSPEFKALMSLRTLGNKIGKDKRTAKRALEELEHNGYIQTNLRDSNKRTSSTVIWVRFPSEATEAILQKPDRKASESKQSTLRIVPPILSENLVPSLSSPSVVSTEQSNFYSESISAPEQGIPALGGALASQGGALTPPINTNNNKLITKITNNKVSTKQAIGIPSEQSSLHRLLEIECLFLKFVERMNVLNAKDLSVTEYQSALWEPYSHSEKALIQRYQTVYLGLTKTPWNVSEAIQAKAHYDQAFSEARSKGLSPFQSAAEANNLLNPRDLNLKNTLQWALVQLADILSLPKTKPIQTNIPGEVVTLTSSPKRSLLSTSEVKKVTLRLQKAGERGDLRKISEIDFETLASQLIFHAEHWSPKAIRFKTSEERINIAVNVAIKRMRIGNWSAPYGWINQNILEREQAAEKWKTLALTHASRC